ncbi:hemicentin-1-like [Helicoverpa armigera]|uniref:hemicentin-1-like n=1 Tax=Helicoverpa armigera TaxID=29058 RepID=UPI003083E0BA
MDKDLGLVVIVNIFYLAKTYAMVLESTLLDRPVGIFRGKYEWANENSLDGGDCSLWVHAATHQLDDGQWQCQVTASNFHLQDALSSPPAKLLVLLAPKSPLIFFKDSRELPGHRLTVAAGNRVTIVCEVAYGNPPSYIEWFLEKDRLTGWPQTNSSEVENTLVGTPRSFLEIEFSKSSNGRQLVCRAHYPSYPSPYYKDYFMMLNVTYAPEVSVSGSDESSLANLEEGLSALTLECRADGNPSPYVWWTKNGQVISTKGANLILVPVSRNDSGKYGCHARNFLGESVPAQIEIDIKYPPRVIWVGPSTVIEANLFSQLTLDCKAEGNPSPSYAWFYNSPSSAHINPQQDSKSRISETPRIELLNVSYHHQGWYICVATNQIASEDR